MNLNDIDDELKSDLMLSFENAFDQIESKLEALSGNSDSSIVNEMFRAMHSIKGNGAMVNLQQIVDYAHEIENVFTRVREGHLELSESLGEAIHVGMDRLRDLHHQEILGSEFANLDIETLQQQFSILASCPLQETNSAINAILGIDEQDESPEVTNVIEIELDKKQQEDLAFFQELALQLDRKTKFWEGRSIQCFLWSQKLNEIGGSPVSYEQLAAAIYVHDFGMSLVPDELLMQEHPFGEEENEHINPHPTWGSRLLKQLKGWDEAADIVLQHHEQENGKGYPNGLSGEQIHPGAKIIAIVDAFTSMTQGRADRSVRRSALRAISEINARKGTQFSPEWVDHFNRLLKEEIRAGKI